MIEMAGHFFFLKKRKEIIRDALKALEIKQTKFKRMPHLFTDDNHYFVVSRIQLYQSIVSLLTDIESQKSNITAILNGLE